MPRLFVLSACHSGDILRVKDWSDFLAVAQGREPGDRETIDDDSGAGRRGRRVNLDRCPAASGGGRLLGVRWPGAIVDGRPSYGWARGAMIVGRRNSADGPVQRWRGGLNRFSEPRIRLQPTENQLLARRNGCAAPKTDFWAGAMVAPLQKLTFGP
ncbi:MAG: hypothetical protein KDA62_16890, partial [Planctomycetales bacterium]|nr:hypothetical protein [Planctomycetales bacterium]